MNSILGKWIKKRNKSDFVVLILLGVMVMIVAMPTGAKQSQKETQTQEQKEQQLQTEDSYKEQLQQQLKAAKKSRELTEANVSLNPKKVKNYKKSFNDIGKNDGRKVFFQKIQQVLCIFDAIVVCIRHALGRAFTGKDNLEGDQ